MELALGRPLEQVRQLPGHPAQYPAARAPILRKAHRPLRSRFGRRYSKALLGYYNQDNYRFEFKTIADRNNALKILERNGFDYELVEDLRSYMVKLPRFAKYAQILKSSAASKETATERPFLMKDLAAVEEAVSLGAETVQGEVTL